MGFPFLVGSLKSDTGTTDVSVDVNILERRKNHSNPRGDFCIPHWSSVVEGVTGATFISHS